MGSRWGTGRIEAFSDGVFAIAITLLVLEINVPQSDFHDLWRGILHQWPSYLGYTTSFVTIGGRAAVIFYGLSLLLIASWRSRVSTATRATSRSPPGSSP
jgi:hypothetical protein